MTWNKWYEKYVYVDSKASKGIITITNKIDNSKVTRTSKTISNVTEGTFSKQQFFGENSITELWEVDYRFAKNIQSYTKRGQTKQGQKYTEEKVAKELFAHISSAQVSQKEMEYIKEYFPRALEKFNNVIEEIASKM